MANGLLDSRFLQSAYIQDVFEEAASKLEKARPLTWLDRLPMVNARDDELMARFTARPFEAAIISDDAKAPVYKGGSIEVFLNSLAKIKVGRLITERELLWLRSLAERGISAQNDEYVNWIYSIGETLIFGVRQRMNRLACAMYLDSLDYNSFGIVVNGSVWGLPSNLNVTPSNPWSDDAGVTADTTATPFSDILAMDNVDADNYGLGPFDRVTMSTTAFDTMCKTTEFRDKAFLQMGAAFTPAQAALKHNDRSFAVPLVEMILGKKIVLDDARGTIQNADGSVTSTRYLPAGKVVLDRTGTTDRELDFGNGEVIEAVVSEMIGGVMLGGNPRFDMGQPAYGPLGFFTSPNQDLNPPQVTGWGVARGFPRRHRPEASALLTVWA